MAIVVRCCKCKKTRWVGRSGFFWTQKELPKDTPTSDTYCPDCLIEAKAEIKQFQDQQGKELRNTGQILTRLGA